MKKNITVQTDNESLSISTMPQPDMYAIKVAKPDGYHAFIVLSDAEMRELKYLIDEILQLANKQDW